MDLVFPTCLRLIRLHISNTVDTKTFSRYSVFLPVDAWCDSPDLPYNAQWPKHNFHPNWCNRWHSCPLSRGKGQAIEKIHRVEATDGGFCLCGKDWQRQHVTLHPHLGVREGHAQIPVMRGLKNSVPNDVK